jgi:hypothetical protein
MVLHVAVLGSKKRYRRVRCPSKPVASMFFGANFRPVPCRERREDAWRLLGTVFGAWADSFACIGETASVGDLMPDQAWSR